jgi:hypothetical protein
MDTLCIYLFFIYIIPFIILPLVGGVGGFINGSAPPGACNAYGEGGTIYYGGAGGAGGGQSGTFGEY